MAKHFKQLLENQFSFFLTRSDIHRNSHFLGTKEWHAGCYWKQEQDKKKMQALCPPAKWKTEWQGLTYSFFKRQNEGEKNTLSMIVKHFIPPRNQSLLSCCELPLYGISHITKDTGKNPQLFFLLPVSGIRPKAISCFWSISLSDPWWIRRGIMGFSFHRRLFEVVS